MNAFKLNGPRDQITRLDFESVFKELTDTYIPYSSSLPKKGGLDSLAGSKTSFMS